jgi:WD40-like Beta Propeller Repeat
MKCMQQSILTLAIALATYATVNGQATTRASVDSSGGQGNANSFFSAISADGRYVVFESVATNLVTSDTNAAQDVFVHDLQSGATLRASIDSSGAQGNNASGGGSLSADGRYVAFESSASNLVMTDVNGFSDIFVHDFQTGTTTLVSVDSSGNQTNNTSSDAVISGNGRFVAFLSLATNLVAGGTVSGVLHIYVHDLQTGTTTLASVDSSGAQGNDSSSNASLSDDGRYVAFNSLATNLVAGDTNGTTDVFIHDLQTGTTFRVSVDSSGNEGNGASGDPMISADGGHVTFASFASNLVAADTNGFEDVFVHDLSTGVTSIASIDSSGGQGNDISRRPSLSADGRFIVFDSNATNLVAGGTSTTNVFMHDVQTGVTTLVSLTNSGTQANNSSGYAMVSGDGRYTVFHSLASDLVTGDTNGAFDVFVRDEKMPQVVASCFGDGSGTACPCSNSGTAGHGCENSSSTGGGLLSASGTASLAADTLVLNASGEKPTALSTFLQGSVLISPVNYGDGLRCAGGTLKRLYDHTASSGAVSAPQGADLSISAQSSALGDPILLGSTRHYQVYYRDSSTTFCPRPQGDTFNVTNSVSIVWSP